jgi:ATP-dependent Clp protease ATP-binding subunit ClpC
MQSGLSAERAFEISVHRIGQASLLKREFAKVGRSKWALLRKLKAVFVGSFDPVPSLSTFTSSARQALELARKEAPRLNHNFIGTEHVLLGLLKLESGGVPNVLKRMKVDREELRLQVENWISIFPPQKTLTHLPYTPRVKKALALAFGEAKACNHSLVGAEHVFLGLMLEGDGVAGRVLRNLGLSIEASRREILRELDGAG